MYNPGITTPLDAIDYVYSTAARHLPDNSEVLRNIATVINNIRYGIGEDSVQRDIEVVMEWNLLLAEQIENVVTLEPLLGRKFVYSVNALFDVTRMINHLLLGMKAENYETYMAQMGMAMELAGKWLGDILLLDLRH